MLISIMSTFNFCSLFKLQLFVDINAFYCLYSELLKDMKTTDLEELKLQLEMYHQEVG